MHEYKQSVSAAEFNQISSWKHFVKIPVELAFLIKQTVPALGEMTK